MFLHWCPITCNWECGKTTADSVFACTTDNWGYSHSVSAPNQDGLESDNTLVKMCFFHKGLIHTHTHTHLFFKLMECFVNNVIKWGNSGAGQHNNKMDSVWWQETQAVHHDSQLNLQWSLLNILWRLPEWMCGCTSVWLSLGASALTEMLMNTLHI